MVHGSFSWLTFDLKGHWHWHNIYIHKLKASIFFQFSIAPFFPGQNSKNAQTLDFWNWGTVIWNGGTGFWNRGSVIWYRGTVVWKWGILLFKTATTHFFKFFDQEIGEIENSKNKGGLWFLSVVPLKNGTPLSDTHSLHTQHCFAFAGLLNLLWLGKP